MVMFASDIELEVERGVAVEGGKKMLRICASHAKKQAVAACTSASLSSSITKQVKWSL